MRLFIAAALPQNAKQELARAAAVLREQAPNARYAPIENYHLTLKFIGESGELAAIAQAMGEAVRGLRPFSLHLAGFELLGRDVGAVRVAGSRELFVLQESLESAMADAGFPREHRRFTPHVTLARALRLEEGQLAAVKDLPLSASFYVQAATLYESRRQGGGPPSYVPLHVQKLG